MLHCTEVAIVCCPCCNFRAQQISQVAENRNGVYFQQNENLLLGPRPEIWYLWGFFSQFHPLHFYMEVPPVATQARSPSIISEDSRVIHPCRAGGHQPDPAQEPIFSVLRSSRAFGCHFSTGFLHSFEE